MGEPSPLVLLLFGTHGTELPGSVYVARKLARAVEVAAPRALVDLIGPVSPWSCRRAFRFDRYLGDPNRLLREGQANLHELTRFLVLWQKHKPKTRRGLVSFYHECDMVRLPLPSIFQGVQSHFRGLPGFVNPDVQSRRISLLVRLISRRYSRKDISCIFLIDVHTGVGPHASTHIYYQRSRSTQSMRYFVDGLADGVEAHMRLRVQAMITETGVVNNEMGMTDALSELAYRTHGYDDPRNLQAAAMDFDWQAKVDHHLSLLFGGQ